MAVADDVMVVEDIIMTNKIVVQGWQEKTVRLSNLVYEI